MNAIERSATGSSSARGDPATRPHKLRPAHLQTNPAMPKRLDRGIVAVLHRVYPCFGDGAHYDHCRPFIYWR